VGAGFSTVTPPPSQVSATSVAQAVWSYTPRSLTEIQNLVNAIQNNDPNLLSTLSDILYVPVPYYAGQVTADQAAAFIDNLIRNYNMPGAIANFITNNPYNLWPPNAVGAFLSSQNMSQTSVTLLLANAGATQMAQALSNLSGNYTNVAIAFSLLVAPSTGANVLNNPNMSVTQAASIINNALINIAPSYPTSVAQLLSLVSSSVLANINAYPNVSVTTLNQVISNAALSATAAQAILYGLAYNYYYNKWVNTVTANAGSTTIATNVTVVSPLYSQNLTVASGVTVTANAGSTIISTNGTISSPLYSQNLTIASGVTVTCGTQTCFFVAQSFNNYGTVVSPYGAPGGLPTTSSIGNYGGTGGGGIVVIAVTAALGTLNVNGYAGGNAVSGSVGGNGGAGGAGVLFIISNISAPMGGTGGYGTNAHLGVAGINGGGGGGGWSYYGGSGGIATVYSFSSPNAMVTYILQGLSDWLLINVLGKAPSSTTPLAYMYGSGGGAGGVDGVIGAAGGGGGGGAGEAVVYGYDVVSGTVNAVGGTGGKTYCSGGSAGGGGGGGGGLVFILYGATAANVTANVAGGVGSTGCGSGGAGFTGAPGTLYIAAVTVNG